MKPPYAAFVVFTAIAACSSAPPRAELPAWAKGPARVVDGGYIVFVASGEDHSPEHAALKAEGAALQDLANECSLVPLGARLEDRAMITENRLRTAYAKVAVEFETCEEAKRARTPERVRQVANVAMTEQLKRYQDLVGEPVDVAALATPEDTGDDAKPAAAATRVPPVTTEYQYFLVRQQIAYEKQVVVLAPPAAFAPGSPEAVRFNSTVNTNQPNLAAFEAAHPAPRTSNTSWAQYRGRAATAVRARAFQRNPGVRSLPPPRAPGAFHGGRPGGGHHHHGR